MPKIKAVTYVDSEKSCTIYTKKNRKMLSSNADNTALPIFGKKLSH